jgi:hypothetical protein
MGYLKTWTAVFMIKINFMDWLGKGTWVGCYAWFGWKYNGYANEKRDTWVKYIYMQRGYRWRNWAIRRIR